MAVCIPVGNAHAQQGHHHPALPADTLGALHEAEPHAAGHTPAPGSQPHETAHPAMPGTLLPNVGMQRDGSGTGWLPDASPMEAVHLGAGGGWDVMLHGAAFLRYNAQDVFRAGERGGRGFGAPNWFMAMARKPLSARSQIGLRSMLSLDPITEGGRGYPLLFQTGESYEGAPLIDRQHPHDLFSELSVSLGHAFSERAGFFGYFGFPGEPAFGPVAFMHRPSAWHNPNSPLGHHWQDATHILFGVATLGARYGALKLDASVFTGREPDEERFGFDRPRFDSYSLRAALNPTSRLALQVSRAFLTEPEVLHPGQDQVRTTASVVYNRRLGAGAWTNTLLWGLNEPHGSGDHGHEGDDHGNAQPRYHAWLAESDWSIGPQAFYGRAEWVQKAAEELGLEEAFGQTRFAIGALTLGTAREVFRLGTLRAMLGGQATLYRVPEALHTLYGRQPASVQVYLRLSPGLMRHGAGGRNAAPAPGHEGHAM